ncbi:DNA-binding response regulator [Clostridium sp. chh4-2]|uniref:response regulator transcription factor n=1 Tax=Clostridium sp. chh4-2 TaxID=2067550 RepID=UPI000CCE8535|nr:response regulator transcription factor [Clostridium sp. chh4-2]PNV59808.1 DNA-binding response regulator [Clostridium sp. chh4-2]
MNKILVVDDDRMVLNDNRQYFEKLGYEVICADTAARAEEIICSAALDCVILDVDLPDESGFDLCARVREKTGLPIVFLSGYTEEQSRIKGLSIGGDDYVCKPYSLAELELRVRARIRAGRAIQPPQPLQYGLLVINPGNRSVSYGERSADLSTFEFDVLYFLARHPGEVFSYDQIFDQVWKSPVNKGLKSLQMMIVRIRQKLITLCPDHDYIQTIRRKGYLFVP